jgi:hypothetical protein
MTKGRVNHLTEYYFRNTPSEVKQAFYDTMEKTGINPFPAGIGNTLAELSIEQDFATGGNDDIFGNSLESAMAAIVNILERIANPLPVKEFDLDAYLEAIEPHLRPDAEIAMRKQLKWEASQREEMLKREKEFYQALERRLFDETGYLDPRREMVAFDVDDGWNIIQTNTDENGKFQLTLFNSRNQNRVANTAWKMEITAEQLAKIKDLQKELGDDFSKYTKFMHSQTFWQDFFNSELSIKDFAADLKKLDQNLSNPKTYQDMLNKLPAAIIEAWRKAEAEAGISGFDFDPEGKALSEFAHDYFLAAMKGNNTDLFGDTPESFLEFAKKCLERLNDPKCPAYNSTTQSFKDSDKLFYQKLVENLSV